MNIDLKNDTVTMTGDDYNRLMNAWEENDSMINEMVMLKAKVNRLESENGQFIHDNNQLLHENKALRLQAESYFEQWQGAKKENRKAKAFDEVRKYALNNHDEFEDRKDRARNHIEYDYFSTLQIANNAVINKCKQLEVEN